MASTANDLAHETTDYSYLNVMQALLWLIFFLPFYLLSGLQLLMSPGTVPQSWQPILVPIFLWILFVTFFFTKAIVYVLISLIVVTSGIAAFVRGYKGRLARICALLIALSVIALPWLLPYEPALDPAPGVTMQVVTQPRNPVESFVKMAYVLSEDVPCEYDLLGWSAENQLYYRRQCGVAEDIWFVHPDRADAPVPMNGLSNDIRPKPSPLRQEEALREQVLEMVRADGYKASDERSYREIMLREGSLRSPDGQWIAAITQHIYGPQDVVLIRAQ